MTLLYMFFFAALGAVVGSFTGVIAERMHTGESWINERSRCNTCGRQLVARDLIPVLSWLLAAGRCRTCGARVPAHYALVELTLGALFVFAYLQLGIGPMLGVFLIALATLAVIVLYDLRHMVVPTECSTLLVLLGAYYAYSMSPTSEALGQTAFIAGCIGLGFFMLYAFSRGRAMGLGDAPVALALALFAGPLAIAGLFFSFWIGAVVGIGILVGRRGGPTMGIEVPFVPFLAAGFLLAYFTGWNPLTFTLF